MLYRFISNWVIVPILAGFSSFNVRVWCPSSPFLKVHVDSLSFFEMSIFHISIGRLSNNENKG